MSLTAPILHLIVGLIFGMIIPRFPLLFFTRFWNLERGLSSHPDPVTVDVPLIQRLLVMRRIHRMGWVLAIIPFGFGILILRLSPEPFAYGLVAGVAWFALSRVVPLDIQSELGIIPMSLIQKINNLRQPDPPCCDRPMLQWEVRSIRCKHCRKMHLNAPRPDLGRIRSDGRLRGAFRVLLTDGRSPFSFDEEE